MREKLIFQDRENISGLVYNLGLLDEEQNWAYLRDVQHLIDFNDAELKEFKEVELQTGQTAGKGLRGYLQLKHKKLNEAGGAAEEGHAPTQNFDSLRGILDTDDKRVEHLHRENIRQLDHEVAGLSSNMGLAID